MARTKVLTLRVSELEHWKWVEHIGGSKMGLSAWLRGLANAECDGPTTEVEREKVKVRSASTAPAKNKCDHRGYEKSQVCYRCGKRK